MSLIKAQAKIKAQGGKFSQNHKRAGFDKRVGLHGESVKNKGAG